jgi:hypothetical protein
MHKLPGRTNELIKERNSMINKLKELVYPRNVAKAGGTIVASLLLGGLAFPFLGTQSARAHEDSGSGGNPNPIVGTWVVQVSLDPASVPPNTPLTFTSIETFGAGGTYLESNNGPAAGGPGGQGNWVGSGHQQFAVTELRLGFDPANHFTGLNKIRRELTLSEGADEFTGAVRVDIFLPNGTPLPIHPAGTFHGTRVAIEPLN